MDSCSIDFKFSNSMESPSLTHLEDYMTRISGRPALKAVAYRRKSFFSFLAIGQFIKHPRVYDPPRTGCSDICQNIDGKNNDPSSRISTVGFGFEIPNRKDGGHST
jgi:hypothetical protein